MVSSSGTSSGSSQLQNSGSEGDIQAAMDQRKRKRMLSNRESARRSRLRKQKHLDDLMAQVSQLRKENSQILTTLNITTQHYLGVESQNSVLRTQMVELSTRLQSLNEILYFMNANNNSSSSSYSSNNNSIGSNGGLFHDESLRPWNMMFMNQPMMMDMFQYC
ncbi:Basic-leucine zipper domain-containing protein [Dioscorea alata]|uniref:BZIP transcription factor 11-like n=2 Tax=Dioscorea TaxID=4672 RepID=A0AB40BGU3_DIOCR|nr:bZIP transcription factor 11-like [Dioscorea cayenensis subsp. rotundata]KAH7682812.1 Basic-leucine zipper domain-containing protein [Dioscorea alata]